MRYIVLLLIIFIGLSCSSTSIEENRVAIANDKKIVLPKSFVSKESFKAHQLITIHRGNAVDSYEVLLNFKSDRLIFSLQSNFGVEMIRGEYGNGRLNVQKGPASKREYIYFALADLILAWADGSQLESILDPSLLVDESKLSRKIVSKGKSLIEVSYNFVGDKRLPVSYRHVERGYKITISNLRYESL